MPLDPKEFEKVFANHFETIAPAQFLANLKAACPYLLDEDSIATIQEINSQEDRRKLLVVDESKAREIVK
jgi:hypothetical protein